MSRGFSLSRLLEANSALSTDSGKVLLERGTKEVPGGVIYSRDIRITVNNAAPLSVEQCLLIMKSMRADVQVIIANEGLLADRKSGINTDVGKDLLRGFTETMKEVSSVTPPQCR
ncbi:hypothetical protein FKM82_023063 [Ascaphus truei]